MFQRLLVAFPVGVSHHDFYFLCFIARFCREKEISILVSLATTFLHILSLCDSFALQEEIIIRIHAFILLHFAFQLPVFVVSSEHHLAYGEAFFLETTKYNPHSPYSASKASSDHFVRAFHDTYGMPTIVTNCSNNYGPYQFPEKLIPLFINNIRHRKPLPVYGKGENVRDWLYVIDHARAIDVIFHKGKVAETYNIGGFNEWKNIDIIKVVIRTVDRLLGHPEGYSLDLITYVTDRKGHDLRYAIDSTKLKDELGWEPSLQFEEGIEKTVRWYLDNQEWMDNVMSGDYQKYYENMYRDR